MACTYVSNGLWTTGDCEVAYATVSPKPEYQETVIDILLELLGNWNLAMEMFDLIVDIGNRQYSAGYANSYLFGYDVSPAIVSGMPDTWEYVTNIIAKATANKESSVFADTVCEISDLIDEESMRCFYAGVWASAFDHIDDISELNIMLKEISDRIENSCGTLRTIIDGDVIDSKSNTITTKIMGLIKNADN